MATPPVQVAITAADLTGPAFASAGAKAQTFQQVSSGSMVSATQAARLFNSELDLGMNRTLVAVIGKSQLLGVALQAAFPVMAIAAFATIAGQVYDKIMGILEGEKELQEHTKLAEEFHKVAEEVAKIQSSIKDIGKTGQQVAVHAAQEAQFALIALQARVSMQRSMAESLDRQKVQRLPGGSVMLPDQGMADALRSSADQASTKLALLQARLDEALAKMYQSFKELGDQNAEAARRAENEWVEAMKSAGKTSDALLHKQDTAPDREILAIREQIAAWEHIRTLRHGINAIANDYIEKLQREITLIQEQEQASIRASIATSKESSKWLGETLAISPGKPVYAGTAQAAEMYKIQTDQNYAFEQSRKILEEARKPLQKYSDEMERWVEIANRAKLTPEEFAKGAKKIAETLDKETIRAWKHFGEEVGRNIEQAALFGRSWSDALKAILVDVTQLIIKMTLLKSLEEKYGEGGSEGGVGGFFTALVGGFAGGHASGGSIPAGMWGLVGEQGPELAFGGSTGLNITPSGRFGQTIYNIDARGADVSVEQRIMRLLPIIEERAVRKAVIATHERQART